MNMEKAVKFKTNFEVCANIICYWDELIKASKIISNVSRTSYANKFLYLYFIILKSKTTFYLKFSFLL